MKAKVYLRVARDDRGKAKVAANVRPNDAPLTDSNNYVLPTVAFGVVLDIPDALFSRAAEIIATLTIPEDQAHIAAKVEETRR